MNILDVNGKMLFECDATTIRETLETAVSQRVDLRGADLARLDLSDAILPKCHAPFANFSGSYLFHANLCGADLCGADFDGAFLIGATFEKANLSCASLDRCDMYRACLSGATLHRCTFKGVDLSATLLDGVHGDISKSHELLAEIIIRYDSDLKAVAAMIAGRKVGCWCEYMDAVYCIFGEEIAQKVRRAFIPYPYVLGMFDTLLEENESLPGIPRCSF